MFATVILAFALSLDGLIVGVSFGLQKISVPLIPKLIISAASIVIISISMMAGGLLGGVLPERLSVHAGALILIGGLLGFRGMFGCGPKKLQIEKYFKHSHPLV